MNCLGHDTESFGKRVRSAMDVVIQWSNHAPRLLALVVLAIYAPAMLCAALLICATSPGPVLVKRAYRRTRGAQDVVYLYEFRTECWRTFQETPVGSVIRKADLHRLPRLGNVLLGDVGVGERVLPLNA